jgi:hypothetical protein
MGPRQETRLHREKQWKVRLRVSHERNSPHEDHYSLGLPDTLSITRFRVFWILGVDRGDRGKMATASRNSVELA